jgi:hypothetical protein
MAKKKVQPIAKKESFNEVKQAEPALKQDGLEAMVNGKTRHASVIAFSGEEYVRYEWRRVPAGFEEKAEAHPHLDVRPRMVPDGIVPEAELEADDVTVTEETDGTDNGQADGDEAQADDDQADATDEG